MAEQSRTEEILRATIDGDEYTKTPQSRNEEILLSILNDTEYTKTPQSREEELLLALKEKIEGGGGSSPVLIDKNITENGTYNAADDNADGYSTVSVDVSGGNNNATYIYNGDVFLPKETLYSIEVPYGVTELPDYCFSEYNMLKYIILPETLTKINSRCIYRTDNLRMLELPASVDEISFYGFANNTLLRIISRAETVPVQIGSDNETNFGINDETSVYVLDELLEEYKVSIGWQRVSKLKPISTMPPLEWVDMANWDFTSENPLIDKINGYTLQNIDVTFDTHGANFTELTSTLILPNDFIYFDTNNTYDIEYEFDIEEFELGYGRRIFTWQSDNIAFTSFNYYDSVVDPDEFAFITKFTLSTGVTDVSGFNNSKLKIRCSRVGNFQSIITVYRNDVELAKSNPVQTLYNTISGMRLAIGGINTNSMLMKIKGLKIRKFVW